MTNKKLLAGILGILLVFGFILVGCDHGGGGGDTEPKLAKWNGTWNAFGNVFDEVWLQPVFAAGANFIQSEHNMTVSAGKIKNVFKAVLGTKPGFKSCVINGSSLTVYSEADATGTPTKIIYTFNKMIQNVAYAFEGDKEEYKYLIALLPGKESPEEIEGFHFKYGNASTDFDALMTQMWDPVLMRQGTTQAEMKETLKVAIEEIPWPDYAYLLPSFPD
jgi:hypothetical protein